MKPGHAPVFLTSNYSVEHTHSPTVCEVLTSTLGVKGDKQVIRKIIVAFAVAGLSPFCCAESAEQLCTAGGYYSGANDQFMSGLAAHILNQRNQLSTPSCGALWREAVEVGQHFSKNGKARPSDARVIAEAANFSLKVYDSITKASGL